MKNPFYSEYHTIREVDGKGNEIQPSRLVRVPNFRWVGPITGWRESDLDRALTGKWWLWEWGLMIRGPLVYVTFNHWLKWKLKKVWCLVRYRGHDRGGMFWSCSRCGD